MALHENPQFVCHLSTHYIVLNGVMDKYNFHLFSFQGMYCFEWCYEWIQVSSFLSQGPLNSLARLHPQSFIPQANKNNVLLPTAMSPF